MSFNYDLFRKIVKRYHAEIEESVEAGDLGKTPKTNRETGDDIRYLYQGRYHN